MASNLFTFIRMHYVQFELAQCKLMRHWNKKKKKKKKNRKAEDQFIAKEEKKKNHKANVRFFSFLVYYHFWNSYHNQLNAVHLWCGQIAAQINFFLFCFDWSSFDSAFKWINAWSVHCIIDRWTLFFLCRQFFVLFVHQKKKMTFLSYDEATFNFFFFMRIDKTNSNCFFFLLLLKYFKCYGMSVCLSLWW